MSSDFFVRAGELGREIGVELDSIRLSMVLEAAVDVYVNAWSWMDWTEAEIASLSNASDLDEVFA